MDWEQLARQYRERVVMLQNINQNGWETIQRLLVIIQNVDRYRALLESRVALLESQMALLRAAMVWHSGTDPDDLLRDYESVKGGRSDA
jgi:hypothetical protein